MVQSEMRAAIISLTDHPQKRVLKALEEEKEGLRQKKTPNKEMGRPGGRCSASGKNGIEETTI